MKINISRQYIYILVLCIVLLVFVIIFSFLVLIPEGKEYRIKRSELKKISRDVSNFDDFSVETFELLKELQGDNRHIITAFDTKFSQERFIKQYSGYFHTLKLSKQIKNDTNSSKFTTYDVNTSSLISSPKSFYNFLDAINKGDWMIAVKFPIKFKRDGEAIVSTFSMRVYSNPKIK